MRIVLKDLIHGFQRDGVYYVVDGGSGSIHVFDELAWKVLSSLPGPVSSLTQQQRADLVSKFSAEDVEGAADVEQVLEQLDFLEQSGQLFHPGYRAQAMELMDQPTYVKALCLNISHDCNLRCEYCFAGKGSFGGERINMDRRVAEQAVDFLLDASGPRQSVELDFFGGEPLMNMDVLRHTVEYGRTRARQVGKEISFTVTTNGVLLNPDIIEYLDREMFNIVLSLDGRREVNDRMRRTVNGRGSAYDLVIDKMLEVARRRQDRQYYVRGTYTRHNLDFARDVAHLAELGFGRISVEPVVTNPDDEYALRPEDLPVLKQQYDELTEIYLEAYRAGRPFDFFHFNLNLESSPCLAKRVAACGAGHEYVAVVPNGDIYPCHQFVGRPEYKLGNVAAGTFDKGLSARFRSTNVFTKRECESCWAQLFCSGGCHANNEKLTGSLDVPDPVSCELMRKRLECAIVVQAAMLEE